VQQQPSRAKVPVWLLLVATIGAGAAIWALAPTSKQQKTDSDSEETSAASGTAPAAGSVAVDLSRLRQAIDVLSRAHDDPAAPDRRAAMNDLLAQTDAPVKLTLLLEAAAADPTAPDKDPLWPDLVQGLSTIWKGETIESGIDLMHIESRPRARDAVVSSFAKIALERPGELTPPQSQKLTETFIDLHNKLPAYQQREVERASRKIAGNDVADLMQGKGMASDEELEVQREYKRSIEENQQRVAAQ
jgi:hypothetical protein